MQKGSGPDSGRNSPTPSSSFSTRPPRNNGDLSATWSTSNSVSMSEVPSSSFGPIRTGPSSSRAHRGPYSRPACLNQSLNQSMSRDASRYSPYAKKPIFVGAKKVQDVQDSTSPQLTSTAQRMIEILQKSTTPVVVEGRHLSTSSLNFKTLKPAFVTQRQESGGPPIIRSIMDFGAEVKPFPIGGLTPRSPSAPAFWAGRPSPADLTDSEKESGGGKMCRERPARLHSTPNGLAVAMVRTRSPLEVKAEAVVSRGRRRSFPFQAAWPLSKIMRTSALARAKAGSDTEDSDDSDSDQVDAIDSKAFLASSDTNSSSSVSAKDAEPAVLVKEEPAFKKEAVKPFIPLPFAAPDRVKQWECPACCVFNAVTKPNCVCCSEPIPASYKNGLGAGAEPLPLLVQAAGVKQWICPTCMVQNGMAKPACVCCTEPRPSKYANEAVDPLEPESVTVAAPVEFKFGFPAVSTATVAPAPALAPTSSFVFGVPNASATTTASAPATTGSLVFRNINASATTTAPVSTPPSSFIFGIPKASTATATVPSPFSFGLSNPSPTESPKPFAPIPIIVSGTANTWECPKCMVFNPVSTLSCVCCTEPIPAKYKEEGLGPAGAGKDKAAVAAESAKTFPLVPPGSVKQWKCPACSVINPITRLSCVSCPEPQPAGLTKAGPPPPPTTVNNFDAFNFAPFAGGPRKRKTAEPEEGSGTKMSAFAETGTAPAPTPAFQLPTSSALAPPVSSTSGSPFGGFGFPTFSTAPVTPTSPTSTTTLSNIFGTQKVSSPPAPEGTSPGAGSKRARPASPQPEAKKPAFSFGTPAVTPVNSAPTGGFSFGAPSSVAFPSRSASSFPSTPVTSVAAPVPAIFAPVPTPAPTPYNFSQAAQGLPPMTFNFATNSAPTNPSQPFTFTAPPAVAAPAEGGGGVARRQFKRATRRLR